MNNNKNNNDKLIMVAITTIVLFSAIGINTVNASMDEIPTLIYNTEVTDSYLGYHFTEGHESGLYAWYHNNGNGTFSLSEVLTEQQQVERDNQ